MVSQSSLDREAELDALETRVRDALRLARKGGASAAEVTAHSSQRDFPLAEDVTCNCSASSASYGFGWAAGDGVGATKGRQGQAGEGVFTSAGGFRR